MGDEKRRDHNYQRRKDLNARKKSETKWNLGTTRLKKVENSFSLNKREGKDSNFKHLMQRVQVVKGPF